MKTQQIIEEIKDLLKDISEWSQDYSSTLHKMRAKKLLSALIEAEKEEILIDFANKMDNQKDIDPEIQSKLTPEFFNELMKDSEKEEKKSADGLFQCPYSKATRCNLTDCCLECETFGEFNQ
jgi:hypothetical protein